MPEGSEQGRDMNGLTSFTGPPAAVQRARAWEQEQKLGEPRGSGVGAGPAECWQPVEGGAVCWVAAQHTWLWLKSRAKKNPNGFRIWGSFSPCKAMAGDQV